MKLDAGVTREHEGIENITWNVLGHTYVPKLLSDNAFVWYADFPADTFVPPHIHRTQDEWICMLEGELEAEFGGETLKAGAGDTLRMPMGEPHGLFNRSGKMVRCLFGVAPTRKLFDLFKAIHNVADPAEVVRLSAQHEVDFLPPPA
ncbi:MAG: cupin domain-containing protein [Inquilinaceae bacterium]